MHITVWNVCGMGWTRWDQDGWLAEIPHTRRFELARYLYAIEKMEPEVRIERMTCI